MTWGGAQWLVLFFIVLRILLGTAKAAGSITIAPQPLSVWQQYFSQRIGDAILVSVLWWGGFFS